LGMVLFKEMTNIRKEDWYGIFWTKWSDAQKEAGLEPNHFSLPAYDKQWIISKIIDYIRELGHFPTRPEFQIRRRNDSEFPSTSALYRHFGTRLKIVESVLDSCKANNDFNDITGICLPLCETLKAGEILNESISCTSKEKGHVYLLKCDKVYKIGKSIDPSRRYKEIKIQMPQTPEEIHVIETDDPSGIEAYWHNRFKDKRQKGEWFKLSADDVKAFKKLKFM
jgi:hypothetical protein